MNKLMSGASSLALAAALTSPAYSQIEEIIVTATKRPASMQSVSVAVSAMSEQTLEELRVNVFSDYLVQLPGVTAGGSGPGQSTIYIRGLASTTPNLTTAGVAGLAPNVALYLDEQPLSQPGRNLDVYAADLERVEVLPGPQGTLFGASSQAGTVRLITNKPALGVQETSLKLGTSYTKGGETSQNIEVVVNMPVTDKLAFRGVMYWDEMGGYIDNVHGTRNASESARFRPAGTVRDNGVPVSAQRAGFQAGVDLSGVTFLDADNSQLVEENFNDARYAGLRISGLYQISDDWSFLLAHSRQDLESDGVFFTDPKLDELEVQRFEEDRLGDKFYNTNWTLEGRVGQLDMIYTGAYTDRESDQRVDYTDYLFVGQYLPYYICDGSVSYPGGLPSGTCQSPNLFVDSATETQVTTHELRFHTPEDYRIQATFGGFYSDLTLTEKNDFTYPGSVNAVLFGQTGFSPNSPFMTGHISDPGPFPNDVIFRNDVLRTDQQLGLFGEVTFDLAPDVLALTLGARYYDIEVDFEGSANSSFCNGFQPDADAFGTDISDLYNGDGAYTFHGTCDTSRHLTYTKGMSIADIQAIDPLLSAGQATQIFNALSAPDKAETDGMIYKTTLTWTPNQDMLFYATYSEGFRPGLLNRPGGAQGPGGYTVPFVLDTDDIKNYEFGWKLDLLDNTLRFNGNAFYNDIENLQTTIFDTSIVNLFFSDNAAHAEISGVEGEITWMPPQIAGLTVSAAYSMLNTEITKVLTPTGDVLLGQDLAFAPSYQGNIRARYRWDLDNGMVAHVMPQIIVSDSSYSDIIEINKIELDSWVTANFSIGVSDDQWMLEAFVDNLTDERAELSNNFVFDRERVTIMRPLTVGVRFSMTY